MEPNSSPKVGAENIVGKALTLQRYVGKPDADRQTILELIDQLLEVATDFSLYIMYSPVWPLTPCRHCGKATVDASGVLVHLRPALPESPDICFIDNPNFSACNDPQCTIIDPKEL